MEYEFGASMFAALRVLPPLFEQVRLLLKLPNCEVKLARLKDNLMWETDEAPRRQLTMKVRLVDEKVGELIRFQGLLILERNGPTPWRQAIVSGYLSPEDRGGIYYFMCRNESARPKLTITSETASNSPVLAEVEVP